jgi:hypothetical protein
MEFLKTGCNITIPERILQNFSTFFRAKTQLSRFYAASGSPQLHHCGFRASRLQSAIYHLFESLSLPPLKPIPSK